VSLRVAAAIGYLAAALVAAWLLLALVAATLPPLPYRLALLAIHAGLVAAAARRFLWPLWRERSDEAVARMVGAQRPSLKSDLLSTVELRRELEAGTAHFSTALAVSLAREVAAMLGRIRPEALLPSRSLRLPALSCCVLLAVGGVASWRIGGTLRVGFGRLLSTPPPAPAESAEAPIIAEVAVRYEYPAYTGRQPRTVAASSGDLLAPRGTQVTLNARAIVEVERAHVEIGERPLVAEVRSGRITVRLTVDQPLTYRFVLATPSRRVLKEALPHRIEVEPDRAPRVEIYAPGDDLELTGQRKIELGYQADDDYGVTEVALVWRIGTGRETREVVRRVAPPTRNVVGRMEWDLAALGLKAGARVAYRFEARDNDTFSGPNHGSSRTLYLRIYSARERHEGFIRRQDEVREAALTVLADRLERPPGAADDSAVGAALQVAREIHSREEALSAAAARMVPELRQDPLAPKDLGPALAGIAERLGALLARESEIVSELTGRQRRGTLKAAAMAKLREEGSRHVAELERDAILLDDLLGRQRLEHLVVVADEIAHSRDRLRSLLAEYRRTRDEALRREIERALAAIEARVAELASKLGELAGEIPDEFLNREALGELNLGKSVAEIRELLDQGDVARAQSELERMSGRLDDLVAALDANLRGYRESRFPAEERALAHMLDRVSDLHAAQQGLTRDTERVVHELRQRTRDITRDRLEAVARAELAKLERLRRDLSEIRREALGPYEEEELERTRSRVDDLARALGQGDLQEALEMGRAGFRALRTLTEDLRDEVARAPWRKPRRAVEVRQALDRSEEALPLLDEVVQDLERALPRPEQLLDGEQRVRLAEQATRQRELRRRADRLRDEGRASPKDGRAPAALGEEMEKALGEAAGMMQRAEERCRGSRPGEAHGWQLEALERLERLRDGLKRARRPRFSGLAGQALDRSPVRIPGSEEHRSPREFRQDLLDAMKERAPATYREQVRRYYEELVR
jgi:hypothetical protein